MDDELIRGLRTPLPSEEASARSSQLQQIDLSNFTGKALTKLMRGSSDEVRAAPKGLQNAEHG